MICPYCGRDLYETSRTTVWCITCCKHIPAPVRIGGAQIYHIGDSMEAPTGIQTQLTRYGVIL